MADGAWHDASRKRPGMSFLRNEPNKYHGINRLRFQWTNESGAARSRYYERKPASQTVLSWCVESVGIVARRTHVPVDLRERAAHRGPDDSGTLMHDGPAARGR